MLSDNQMHQTRSSCRSQPDHWQQWLRSCGRVLCNVSLRATAGCQSKVALTHDYSSVAVTLKGTREHHSVSCCSFLQTERVGSVKYKQIIDREAVCSLYSTKGTWLCDLQRYTSLRPRIITQAKIRWLKPPLLKFHFNTTLLDLVQGQWYHSGK